MQKHIDRLGTVLATGGQIVQQGNTLFMYKANDDKVVEFHTYNAEPANLLVENTRKFFRMLKKVGAQEVYTRYSNPKISELFQMLSPEFKTKITKSEDYKAKVKLQ